MKRRSDIMVYDATIVHVHCTLFVICTLYVNATLHSALRSFVRFEPSAGICLSGRLLSWKSRKMAAARYHIDSACTSNHMINTEMNFILQPAKSGSSLHQINFITHLSILNFHYLVRNFNLPFIRLLLNSDNSP